MPMKGIHIDGKPIPWKEIPPSILQPELALCMAEENDRGGVHLTDLTGCPHEAVRRKRYDYYVTPQNAYWMARGKAFDALIEKHAPAHRITQPQLWRKLDGVWISGHPDIFDRETGVIEDNKAIVKLRGYEELNPHYVVQVNGYRWMCQDEVEVKGLQLDACTHFSYVPLAVPMLELWEVEMELSEALYHLIEVAKMDDVVPKCDDATCYCHTGDTFWDYRNPQPFGEREIYADREGAPVDDQG